MAEFYNTLSSVPIVLVGLAFLRQCWRRGDELRFQVVAVCILVVGLGSCAFHGTLSRFGQQLDEIPMVFTANACLYVALTLRNGGSSRLAFVLSTWTAVATLIYFMLGFGFFIAIYVASVAGVVFVSAWQAGRSNNAKERRRHMQFAAAAALLYAGGFIFLWLPEQFLCGNRLHASHPTVVQRLHLHAWFHLTSAAGPYFFMCFTALSWREASGRKHKVRWQRLPELLYMRVPVVVDV